MVGGGGGGGDERDTLKGKNCTPYVNIVFLY